MTFIIPQQESKKYVQTNAQGFSGNIKKTKNITFDEKGYLKLSKRTRLLYDSATYTNLVNSNADEGGNVERFVRTRLNTGRIWVCGNKKLHYLDNDLVITEDVAAGTPTLNSSGNNDICSFQAASNEVLLCAYSSGLKSWNGTAWSSAISTDVTSKNTLAVFENLRCAVVAGGNLAQLIDASLTKSTLLTLPPNHEITCMEWNNNKLFLGTSNLTTNEGFIFEWDGTSTSANYGHPVGGQVLAMVRYKTGIAFVTSLGRLGKLDGSVAELANFPIFYAKKQWMQDGVGLNSYIWNVTKGGMSVDGDTIHISANARYITTNNDDTDDSFEDDFLSGVWCYDPEVGLYHKYSVGGSARTVTGAITTANVDTATDIITIPSSICPDTGTPVFYDDASDGAGTKITPLVFNKRYFVIKLSGTTLKLATTYANALAGTAIDLTSTGNNSQTLAFCPNSDFGGSYQIPTAIFLYKTAASMPVCETSKAAKLLIGSSLTKTSATSYVGGIHAVEYKQENRGYVEYARLQSPNVRDTWQNAIIKFRKMKNPEDKIILKYREARSELYQQKLYATTVAATWVTSTTFTTSDITDMSVGNEVEIVSGAGCGYLAHITNISDVSGGLYTITIDETVQNISAGQTFYYIVEDWIKSPTTIDSSMNSQGWLEIPIGKAYKTLDIKLELRGEDTTIEETQIKNALHK